MFSDKAATILSQSVNAISIWGAQSNGQYKILKNYKNCVQLTEMEDSFSAHIYKYNIVTQVIRD